MTAAAEQKQKGVQKTEWHIKETAEENQSACTLPPCFLCGKGAGCTARVQKGTECPWYSDKQIITCPPDGFQSTSEQNCNWLDSLDVGHSTRTLVIVGGNTKSTNNYKMYVFLATNTIQKCHSGMLCTWALGFANDLNNWLSVPIPSLSEDAARSRRHDLLPNQHPSSRQSDSLALALISISSGPVRLHSLGVAVKR